MTEWLLVPTKPSDEHIESIALRLDHGHGIRTIGWPMTDPLTMETDEQFAMRQEANRSTARQMYEEATGQGFYKIDSPKNFVCRTCGHSTLETSGWASANAKLRRQCEDMAMMIKRLIHANQATGKKAMEMVERFELLGTPMRRAGK